MCATTFGQDVILIQDFNGKHVVRDTTRYALTGSTEYRIIIQHYELLTDSQRTELIDVVIDNIDFYLDQIIVMELGHMQLRKPRAEILTDLHGIVSENVKLYDYQVDEPFPGFSQEFAKQLEEISRLTWDASRSQDGNSSFDSQQMAYNYVQARIASLKDMSTAELLDFARDHVHVTRDLLRDEYELVLPPNADTSDWQIHSILFPFDFTLSRISSQDIGLYFEPEVIPMPSTASSDPGIMRLLESNNRLISELGDKMLVMQEEIRVIRTQGRAFQAEYEELNTALRDVQRRLAELGESNISASSPGLHSSDLVESTIYFEKNSYELGLTARLELNTAYQILLENSQLRAVLTGHADTSGNPELNARISRKRALAARQYLLQKGIPPTRLIVNFLGDQESNSERSEDRKVVISWIEE